MEALADRLREALLSPADAAGIDVKTSDISVAARILAEFSDRLPEDQRVPNNLAELGDLRRFAHPKQLMSFLGLVPSEYSSGASRRLGAITKCGNAHVRRVLIEAAWTYRFPARLARELQIRQEGQPKIVRDIAWRAQLRLCTRYRRLQARGVHQNKICIAIARELTAFIWDIARHVPLATH